MKVIKAKPSVHRPLTEEMLDAAITLGEARQANSLQAVSVSFEESSLVIRFEDGSGVLLPVKLYPEFAGFEAADYASLTIGFAGTALCHEGKDLDFHCRHDFSEPAAYADGRVGRRLAQRASKQRCEICGSASQWQKRRASTQNGYRAIAPTKKPSITTAFPYPLPAINAGSAAHRIPCDGSTGTGQTSRTW